MSNPTPRQKNNPLQHRHGPTVPTGYVVGQYRNYTDAAAVVERLIEGDFPAAQIAIVGSDVKLVERVRGRLGYGRVAYSGAITGIWMGLIFAILIGAGVEISATGEVAYNPSEFMAAVVIGAGIGMLFNILRFSFTRNRRGFISMAQSVASNYEVVVPESEAPQATKALSKTPAQAAVNSESGE